MKTIIILAFIMLILLSYMSFAQTNSDITYGTGTIIEVGTGADICATNIFINGTYTGGGTICSAALPVTLSSFESRVKKNDVNLIWVTEIETNNSGFDIERKTDGNDWSKIAFVQGSGTTNSQRLYTYEDKKLPTKIYQYRLKQIDYNGQYEYHMLNNDVIIGKPGEYKVGQNYPNPSNPKSKIDYEIPVDGKVSIKVYDIIGKEVATIVNEFKPAGYYTADFDGSNLASGVYIYRLTSGEFSDIKKTILVK
jgi:hypothetical protein